ncbi:MAG: hypothetical protein IPI77_18475 [Saprospiraceae bacterium]|nr:hypothetical protein [Saprospiraceae bacterium]
MNYLQFCRNKCHHFISSMTDEIANSNWTNESKTMSYNVIEILLYNMRHVQHHSAQLNLLLRHGINDALIGYTRRKINCDFEKEGISAFFYF